MKRKTQYPSRYRSRHKITLKDEYSCAYCGGLAETVDHVYPLSRAKELKERRMPPSAIYHILENKSNQVPACLDCNEKKSNMRPAEWFDLYPEYIDRFMESARFLSDRIKETTGLWADEDDEG